MAKILFLGIKQVMKETFDSKSDSEKSGYIWFVRDTDSNSCEVYLGNTKYGETNSSEYIDELMKKNKKSVGLTDALELPSDFGHDSIVSGITDLSSDISEIDNSIDEIKSEITGITKSFDELKEQVIDEEITVSKAISLLRELIGANNVFKFSSDFKYDNLIDAIEDRYTKEEVNKLIIGAFKFKGVVEFKSDLNNISEKSDGDVYQVTYEDEEKKEKGIKYNSEFVWSENVGESGEWIELGQIFDTTELNNKIDTVDEKVDELDNSLATIAKSGEYEDLKNKPVVGDVQIFDYEELPYISYDYNKIIARVDYKLYQLVQCSGWSFNPIEFSKENSAITETTDVKPLLRKYMNFSLGYNDGETEIEIAKDSYFSNCSLVSTINTIGNGILIGNQTETGVFEMDMSSDNKSFKFNTVEVNIKQFDVNDYVDINVAIGWINPDGSFNEYTSKIIYIIPNGTIQSKIIKLTYKNKIKALKINTITNGHSRCIIDKIDFNQFYYNSDIESENKTFNKKFYWSVINGLTISDETLKI